MTFVSVNTWLRIPSNINERPSYFGLFVLPIANKYNSPLTDISTKPKIDLRPVPVPAASFYSRFPSVPTVSLQLWRSPRRSLPYLSIIIAEENMKFRTFGEEHNGTTHRFQLFFVFFDCRYGYRTYTTQVLRCFAYKCFLHRFLGQFRS